MSRLDWEKQNRKETPKAKKQQNEKSKILKAYQNGTSRERERIIKVLEENFIDNELLQLAIKLIKGDK